MPVCLPSIQPACHLLRRMARLAVCVGVSGLFFGTASAASTHPNAIVLQIMRDHDCRLDTQSAEAAFAERGLSPEDVSGVASAWANQGLAGMDGATFEIAPALCGVHGHAAGDIAGRADVLFDMVQLNHCRMGDEEAALKLPPAGFSDAETPALMDKLIADGRAHRDDQYFVVIGGAC